MKAKDQKIESPNKKKKKSSSDLTTSLEKRKVLPSPRKRETVKRNKKNVTTIETSDGRHRKKDVTSIKPRKKKTRNPTKEITEGY
ncbi:hypothetical protein GCK32_019872 [Trichostrongylus colubriformis]|uniref:Uncharacterized protein n=1 Tax=Trichostrongylus colubriformis TaxID=6319 RepID=A0AAN8FP71_TRICO